MSYEAAIPGTKITSEQLQMICCRYYTTAQYVRDKQVLEVGCGTGLGLGYLGDRAKRVIGGDYSKNNLRYAYQHYKGRIELMLLDAQKLPFRDSSLDVVLAMETIQYLTCLEDFLRENHRILRKDGILILCLPNKDIPGFHKSPLGYKYYSVPELSISLLSHFSVELFGAFPLSRGSTREQTRSWLINTTGKILDIIPQGKEIKECLNRTILGRTIVVKPELTDDMITEGLKLVPISSSVPDYHHKILYAIAQRRD